MPDIPQAYPGTRPFGSLIPHDPDLPAGTRLGEWLIESKIGEGGMGTVYAAVHAEIGKHAAIKVVRAALCATPLAGERFLQEARAVNQIEHPNVVDIFQLGRLPDGRPYLVMELLRGTNLADRLSAGRMPAVESIEVLLQICSALEAAHGRGVIHRDLKPDNIFLAETSRGTTAKLVDWGIAKLDDPNRSVNASITRSGVLIGTPQYCSPEQARGRPVDASTDIYSLGAIAYELFLEEPPFTADNVADLIAMHLREPPPPPSEVWPDIPPALDTLMTRMLSKEPAVRPSLGEVIATLTSVRVELASRTRPPARLAAGSVPPPMGSAVRWPTLDTLPSGLPVAIATSESGATEQLPDHTGPTPALVERTAPVARVPSPTFEDITPRPRRRGWLAAAMVVIAGGAIVAVIAARGRAPRRAAPVVAEDGVVEAAAVVTPPAIETPADPPAPAVAPSAIELQVTPATARVRVDGVAVTLEHGRLVQPLAPGPHALAISAPGHQPYARTIEVSEGRTHVLEVALDAVVRERRRQGDRRPTVAPIDPDGTIDPFE